jgi:hypothetical protein
MVGQLTKLLGIIADAWFLTPTFFGVTDKQALSWIDGRKSSDPIFFVKCPDGSEKT